MGVPKLTSSLIFLACTSGCDASAARELAPHDSAGAEIPEAVDATRLSRRGRLAVLPIIFSSPNTGFAAGVLPQYFFRTSPYGRPSNVRLDVYYTQEKQYHLQLASQAWLKDNAYRLTGKVSFKRWPTSFYGIGPESKSTKEPYTERVA